MSISPDEMCFNVAIRTMLLDDRRERVDDSVGGGIIADSDPVAVDIDKHLRVSKPVVSAGCNSCQTAVMMRRRRAMCRVEP